MRIAAMTRREKIRSSSSVRQRNGAADEEEVDRHVGENHERNEWDTTLPLKIERADLTALSSDPIATAVNDQEQD